MTQDEILWDITHAKLQDENCQSVSDIKKALNKNYNEDDVVAINKFMFSVKMMATLYGKHTDEVLADMFVAMVCKNYDL